MTNPNPNQPAKTPGNPLLEAVIFGQSQVKDWPSIAAQEAYWKQKEAQQDINEKLAESLDTLTNTMQHILNALSGLKDICEHQQKAIDKLNAAVAK